MAIVDELKIYARAGKGGDGVVRWRREKFIDKGGPSGGNGGRGGDVYFEGVRNNLILEKYSHNPKFIAESGEPGSKALKTGGDGADLYIKVPVGSRIEKLNSEEEEIYEILEEGEVVKILKGGRGGLGNAHFKSSTNTTPYQFTKGKPGEESEFMIELRLIADVGLVGLPNAGKSTLLNTITNANAKVGSYPFTTLDPNLGSFGDYIIADIPGLIEGASGGKGLGHKFLKHITRTKKLLHLVSLENEDVVSSYKTIRKELEDYDKELKDKEEFVILTKTDLVSEKILEEKKKELEKIVGKKVYTITAFDDKLVKQVLDEILK